MLIIVTAIFSVYKRYRPKKKGPKKHGLDKKYKSWRRGKSVNATCGASLKNQLRGQKRLLSKLRNSNDDKTN